MVGTTRQEVSVRGEQRDHCCLNHGKQKGSALHDAQLDIYSECQHLSKQEKHEL